MRIVILSAFKEELVDIFNIFSDIKETVLSKRKCWYTKHDKHEILISLTGIGTIASSSTTTVICENFAPDVILFFGVAGGIALNQEVGDLVFASKIIDADLFKITELLIGTPFESCLVDPHTSLTISNECVSYPIVMELGNKLNLDRLELGAIVTSNTFPSPKSVFHEIKNLNCKAIEMENMGVYKAASFYDIPIITVRAISNLLDNEGNDLGTKPDAMSICTKQLSLAFNQIINLIDILNPSIKEKEQEVIYFEKI
jgi:nucleoside phosphorylase